MATDIKYQRMGNQARYGNSVDDEEICRHTLGMLTMQYINTLANGAIQFESVDIKNRPTVVVAQRL